MRRFRSASLFAAVVVVLSGIATPVGASAPFAWVQQTQLVGTDRGPNDWFGGSIAISGSTAVVGALYHGGVGSETGPGAAYVFENTGSQWVQTAELKASDGAKDDRFGISVAISGSTIVVGAQDEDYGTGAAYVFTRGAAGWKQTAKLMNPDPDVNADEFGTAVAISGSNVIVGAPHAEFLGAGMGAAYVFTGRKKSWTLQQSFLDPSASNDAFGGAVAISGTTALIGATGQSTGAGAVYVVGETASGWVPQQTLTASTPEIGEFFGKSVAIDGTTAVIGAEYGDGRSGSAYVFSNPGTGWVQNAELTDPQGTAFGEFASAVAISGLEVAVGAPSRHNARGAVLAYKHSASGWAAAGTITASDGHRGDAFGVAVAVAGAELLAGAPQHKVGSDHGVVDAFSRS